MEPFSADGTWWLPSDPGKKFYGRLTCDEEGEIRLAITGSLGLSMGNHAASSQVILGNASIEHVGQQVTLRDCILTEQSIRIPSSEREELYFAQRAYMGAHLPTAEDLRFQTARFDFSGLSAWAWDFGGFSVHDKPLSVSWTQPESLSGQLNNSVFMLRTTCTVSSALRQKVLAEKIALSLDFGELLSAPDLEFKFTYPLQNFLTFATDHPNALTELQVSGHAREAGDIKVIGPRTFSDESQAKDVTQNDMLFSLSAVRGRVHETLNLWLDLSMTHREAFSLYFGMIYRPPSYTDMRLTLLMQVLSLYVAARSSAASAAPNSQIARLLSEASSYLPGELRNSFSKVLASHPLLAAEHALDVLLQENREEFQPLLQNKFEEPPEAFGSYALQIFRYLLTRISGSGSVTTTGADYYWLTERLKFLFKISILKDLGFTSSEISGLLDKNPLFVFLRDSVPVTGG